MTCGRQHVLHVLHFLLIITTFHETSEDLFCLQMASQTLANAHATLGI